jgi:hypothetical protein
MAKTIRTMPLAVLMLGGCAPAAPPATASAAGRGLWVGAIRLCRDTVERASAGDDFGGMPVLTVTLKPALRDTLRRETETRVGRPLPVRLDGRLVSEPIVREPIAGGAISLSGASGGEVEALRAAALADCAAATATAGLGRRAALGGVAVTPLRVEEDSRCPTEVQCIQAGTVRVAVRIREGGARREAVLPLGRPLRLGAGWLTLCAVTPYPARPGAVPRAAYRFSFALGQDASAGCPGGS